MMKLLLVPLYDHISKFLDTFSTDNGAKISKVRKMLSEGCINACTVQFGMALLPIFVETFLFKNINS